MRETGLLDFAEPVQERQLAPGHLDVDGVGQPGAVGGDVGVLGGRGEQSVEPGARKVDRGPGAGAGGDGQEMAAVSIVSPWWRIGMKLGPAS